MSSAIGGYIHLTSFGYLNKEGHYKEAPTHQAANVKKYDGRTLRKYENYLNAFQGNNVEKLKRYLNKDQLANYQKWRVWFEEEMKKRVVDHLGELASYDFTHMAVTNYDIDASKTTGKVKRVRSGNHLKFELKRLAKTLETLFNIAKDTDDLTTFKEIQEGVKDFSTVFQSADKDYLSFYNAIINLDYDTKDSAVLEKHWEDLRGGVLKPKATLEALGKINALINKYAKYPDIVGGLEGIPFEATLRAGGDILNNVVYEEVVERTFDTLNRKGEGSERVSTSTTMEKRDSVNTTINLGEGTQFSINAVQKKVDVTLQWEEEELSMSAKNIKVKDEEFKTQISLEEGNFINMMERCNGELVNHYFNVISPHLMRRSNKTESGFEKRLRKEETIPASRTEYFVNEMRKEIAYAALAGNRKSEKNADLLIVNQKNATGESNIKIYQISNIMKMIEKNPSLIGIKVSERPFSGFRVPVGYNRFEKSGAETRVKKVKDFFNTQSIKVNLNYAFLGGK